MTDALVFEEPPQRTQRSEHYTLLMALKSNPGRGFARVKVDLDEKDANRLAAQLRAASSKLGDGFEVIARWIPASGKHGVWAKYDAPVQAAEGSAVQIDAEAQAAAMNAAAMTPEDTEAFERATAQAKALGSNLPTPTVPTAADVLQRGVVDEPAPWDGLPEVPPLSIPVGGAVPEYEGKRTTAYGEPAF